MSNRLLAIDADLSAPPSSSSCFRDLTLQASIKHYETIVVSPLDMIDLWDDWMARRGIWDYVVAILTPEEVGREQIAIRIEGGSNTRLTIVNLHHVLRLL